MKSFKTFQLTLLKVTRHFSLDISWENCQKVLLNVLCSHTYTYKPVTRFENVFEWKTTCFLLQNGIVSCWSLVCSFVLNNLLVPPFLGDKKEKKKCIYSMHIPAGFHVPNAATIALESFSLAIPSLSSSESTPLFLWA